jgi:drug/metabolite transporter (DMT)-like permease
VDTDLSNNMGRIMMGRKGRKGSGLASGAAPPPGSRVSCRILDMREDDGDLWHGLILLLAAVIWGFAFVAQRAGMEHVGPFTFNGIRFLLGSFSLLPILVFARRRIRRGRDSMRARPSAKRLGLGLLGLILFAAAALQQVGLVYTTAGKAGFITGLYVLIVPLLGLFLRQRVRWTVWAGAAAGVGGLYLLAGLGGGRIGLGDGLVLAGAFGWAVHVQLVGWLVRRIDPIRIAVVQTAVCGILSLAVGLATEPVTLMSVWAAAPALSFAGVLSVGVAYTLQIVGQRRIDPSRAGIIVSLEAVFAALGGWLVLGERASGVALVGGALMLAGMVLSQIGGGRRVRAP